MRRAAACCALGLVLWAAPSLAQVKGQCVSNQYLCPGSSHYKSYPCDWSYERACGVSSSASQRPSGGLTAEQHLLILGIAALIQGLAAPDPQADAKRAAELAAEEAARAEAERQVEAARQRQLEEKKNRLLAEMQGVDQRGELDLILGADQASGLELMGEDDTAGDLFGARKARAATGPAQAGSPESAKAGAATGFEAATRSASDFRFRKSKDRSPEQAGLDAAIANDPRMREAIGAFNRLTGEHKELEGKVDRLQTERAAASDPETLRRLEDELAKARKAYDDKSKEVVSGAERVEKLHRQIGTKIAEKRKPAPSE